MENTYLGTFIKSQIEKNWTVEIKPASFFIICALDMKEHLSANMRATEESRSVLGVEQSGHSRKKCLTVSAFIPNEILVLERNFILVSCH